MTVGLHDTGEEFILDYVFTDGATRPASVDIGLYNDSTDNLADSDDVSAITTEPSGGSYARQSASFPGDFTNSDDGSDWQTVVANQTFDTSDSSQSIDSWFIVINFDSDDAGDGGTASDHLLVTGNFNQTYDLSQIDSFTSDNVGFSLT